MANYNPASILHYITRKKPVFPGAMTLRLIAFTLTVAVIGTSIGFSVDTDNIKKIAKRQAMLSRKLQRFWSQATSSAGGFNAEGGGQGGNVYQPVSTSEETDSDHKAWSDSDDAGFYWTYEDNSESSDEDKDKEKKNNSDESTDIDERTKSQTTPASGNKTTTTEGDEEGSDRKKRSPQKSSSSEEKPGGQKSDSKRKNQKKAKKG